MNVKLWFRALLVVMALSAVSQVKAQTVACKDTAEHHRLQAAMWKASAQDSATVVYKACKAFYQHARAENDPLSSNIAWVCGILYNLDKMNIQDAYHITQLMKTDIMDDADATELRYFIPQMMGHVYNTCGNISGAQAELLKSAELIKGTRYEPESLPFIYIALAHVHLNNNVDSTFYWLDKTVEVLTRHPDSRNYYRASADAYAIKAIARFKQKKYDEFREAIHMMNDAQKKVKVPSGDLFVPYALIYETLLDGHTEEAIEASETLMNKKEQYMLLCDIYRYIGDNDKAFLMQRELMHVKDSIAGVMIAENMQQQEKEMGLLNQKQKMSRILNIVLCVAVALAVLTIVLMTRNSLNRRRYQKRLLASNQELEAANEHVQNADKLKMEFVRNVSHEIRTPLNIINGFSQVLTDEYSSFNAEERKEIARTMGNSTRQITSLVNKMLALANESSKNLLDEVEKTDAIDISRKAIAGMPELDEKKVKVWLDDQTNGDSTIYTNGDSLLQMLGEFLENSAKFTEEGHIVLKVRKAEQDGQQRMLFTVEDTGCGIPIDKVDTIFDRWVKVDEFKVGLGLGLAYCRETAEKLGGTLKLDQTSEKGTTFTLSLPVIVNSKEIK